MPFFPKAEIQYFYIEKEKILFTFTHGCANMYLVKIGSNWMWNISKMNYPCCRYMSFIKIFAINIGVMLISEVADPTLTLFEGNLFKCPVGYKEVLTALYGDYMKLPPEEKRVSHHVNKTYLKR